VRTRMGIRHQTLRTDLLLNAIGADANSAASKEPREQLKVRTAVRAERTRNHTAALVPAMGIRGDWRGQCGQSDQ
jgi:hypothetical protein